MSGFNYTSIFSTDFIKITNMNYHDSPSIGSRAVAADGRTGIMKLIVTFRNFSNAPKNWCFFSDEVMFTLSRNINVKNNTILSFKKSWKFMKFLCMTLDSRFGLKWERTVSQGLRFYEEIPTIRLNSIYHNYSGN